MWYLVDSIWDFLNCWGAPDKFHNPTEGNLKGTHGRVPYTLGTWGGFGKP